MTQPGDEEPAADTWSGTSGGGGAENELTRAEFRGRVRTLFRRYGNAGERGMLRDYQQAFIDRNERATPAQRYWLVVHLRLYERLATRGIDDPVGTGLDPFTDSELRRIEAAAGAQHS
jgi:hypothetical protein